MRCAPDHRAEEGGTEQHEDGDKQRKQRCRDKRNDGDRTDEHANGIARDCTEFGGEEAPVSADERAHRDDQLLNVVAEALALR